MAWGDLGSNDLVTFTNMQTSGIALNSGQSHTTSNDIMTKTAATTKYNLNTSNSFLSAKSGNDCVAKRDLEAGAPPYYSHWLSYDNGTNLAALCGGPTYEYFSNVASLAAGERIYSNSALTTYPAAGYYSDGYQVFYANNVGLLSEEGFCGIHPF